MSQVIKSKLDLYSWTAFNTKGHALEMQHYLHRNSTISEEKTLVIFGEVEANKAFEKCLELNPILYSLTIKHFQLAPVQGHAEAQFQLGVRLSHLMVEYRTPMSFN